MGIALIELFWMKLMLLALLLSHLVMCPLSMYGNWNAYVNLVMEVRINGRFILVLADTWKITIKKNEQSFYKVKISLL